LHDELQCNYSFEQQLVKSPPKVVEKANCEKPSLKLIEHLEKIDLDTVAQNGRSDEFGNACAACGWSPIDPSAQPMSPGRVAEKDNHPFLQGRSW